MEVSKTGLFEGFLQVVGKIKNPRDIALLLEYIVEVAKADGAVLWRLAPGSVLEKSEKHGRFLPIATWCRFDDVLPWYYLPAHSVTGEVWLARNEKPYYIVESLETDPLVPAEARRLLLTRWNMRYCASIPICQSPQGFIESVTFYRRSSPIEAPALQLAIPLVQELPTLYQLARDRLALEFLTALNYNLRFLDTESAPRTTSLPKVRLRLDQVCKDLESFFNVTEASILLAVDYRSASEFPVQAQVWKWPGSPYAKTYKRGQGITGWVLANQLPLRISDLVRFGEDREWILSQHSGLEWEDLLDIKKQVREKFKLPPGCDERELPMASFLCVPVVLNNVLGVIRCCGRNSSPWTFEESDIRLLELVAQFVGSWWLDQLEAIQLQGDSLQLRKLVDDVTRLHQRAAQRLVKESKTTDFLLSETLRTAMASLNEVDHGSLRLIDFDSNELYYKVQLGELWKRLPGAMTRRFSLDPGNQKSAGSFVVKNEKFRLVNSPETDDWELPLLTDVKRKLYVPVKGGGKILGVLDLGRTSEIDFQERDAAIAENFAAQLGLYIHLDEQLEGRRRDQKRLQDEQETQLRTFENLRHQIYGPVGTAAMTLARLSRNPSVGDEVRRDLSLARGDALRAAVMVRSLELFADLATSQAPRVRPERLQEDWLFNRLTELSEHQQVLRSRQKITFFVKKGGMESLSYNPVLCDLNLLEHAVSNLLDNAGKYSNRGSRVLVTCGTMDHEKLFYIAVQNQGFRIENEDVAKMAERGWRSDLAWRVSADGAGIGLYFVDAIMKAHKGKLQISPTNSLGVNDVRLIFPASGVSLAN
jgi:signal transduction histidine kinase